MDRYTGAVTREQEAATPTNIPWNSAKAVEIRNSVAKNSGKAGAGAGGKSGSGGKGTGGSSGGTGNPPNTPKSNGGFFGDPEDYISKESYKMATSTSPAPGYQAITENNWKHILVGDSKSGGHRYGANRLGKKEFPKNWDDNKIYSAISTALNKSPTIQTARSRIHIQEIDGVTFKVFSVLDGETYYPKSAYPLYGRGVTKNTKYGKIPVPSPDS